MVMWVVLACHWLLIGLLIYNVIRAQRGWAASMKGWREALDWLAEARARRN